MGTCADEDRWSWGGGLPPSNLAPKTVVVGPWKGGKTRGKVNAVVNLGSKGEGGRGGEVHEGVNPREGRDRDGGEDVGGDGATRPCGSHGAWMKR